MATLKTYVTDIELDHSSPVPLYHQISEPIKNLILDGTIPPGAKLEDELSMASRLGVSRPTARRALQSLVDLRLVVRKRAVGTIVAPKEIHRQVKLSSLYDDLRESGQKPTTEVISYEEVAAEAEIAEDLRLNEGQTVVKIVRLRLANGEPLAIMTNYLPLEVAPSEKELRSGGLYDAMRSHGHEVVSASQTISARKASSEEAETLQESRGAAILSMRRIAYNQSGVPIEIGDHVYRASRYRFTISL
ncbi:GntR family transcriptional regulator [Varibaculum cambriense]|uniref:GntR family transcriptional regulator n=1 Tax=Varibaculum cambriense TaxID=184870 RepID=UPI0029000A39|nr:GntR family transcriptional regulator [Varibaculum cambriense]MDU1223556.1 GntR family transcriptional regulator [Varibaculum cambriense]MDU3274454.1 GntR family transcriptional regulator [Varibaculum cambriense]